MRSKGKVMADAGVALDRRLAKAIADAERAGLSLDEVAQALEEWAQVCRERSLQKQQ